MAVVAILKELGAPHTSPVLIEGESLLNDGVAFALFMSLEKMLAGETSHLTGELISSVGGITVEILYASVVGSLIGLAGGFLFAFLRLMWNEDPVIEVVLTMIAVMLTFLMGELANSSGVLALVVLGLVFASCSRGHISPEAMAFQKNLWHTLEFIANTIVFVFSGVVVVRRFSKAVRIYDNIGPYDAGMLFVLFLALNAIRFLMVFLFHPLMKRMGYGMDVSRALVISWSGLRGAVGLIGALIVSEQTTCEDGKEHENGCIALATQERIIFHMAGIVALTLLLNGWTAGRLVSLLKLNVSSGAAREMYKKATLRLHHFTEFTAKALVRQPRYNGANMASFFSYMPVYSDETLKLVGTKNGGTVTKESEKRVKAIMRKFQSSPLVKEVDELIEARYRFLNLVKGNIAHSSRQAHARRGPT